MSGISTSTGVFSGIDSKSLIDQILAVEGRSRILVQRRVAQLQQQNAAYLDINSRLSSIKTAASAFRLENLFKTKAATSSNEDALTATASNSAAPGTYSVRVERLVSAQQLLSRGLKKFAAVTWDTDDPSAYARRFSPESNQVRDKITAADELRVLVAVDEERGRVGRAVGHCDLLGCRHSPRNTRHDMTAQGSPDLARS